MTVVVRPAVNADIPWIIEELAQMDQFFGAGRPLMPDAAFARERLTWMIEDHETFLCLMVTDQHHPPEDEKPLGFLFSLYQFHFFTPTIYQCQSLLWWVRHEARGTVAGARLLDQWIDYAKLRANWLVLTVQDKTPINPDSLVKRRGFRLIDQKYLLEIPDHLPGVPL
jgi:hypothetical protein